MTGTESDIEAAVVLLERARDALAARLALEPAWAAFGQLEARERNGQPLTAVDVGALKSRLEARLDVAAAGWRRLAALEAAIAAIGPGRSPADMPLATRPLAVAPPAPLSAPLSPPIAAIADAVEPEPLASADCDPRDVLSRIRSLAEPSELPLPAPLPAVPPASPPPATPPRRTPSGSWPVLPDGIHHHRPSELPGSVAAPPTPAIPPTPAPPAAGDSPVAAARTGDAASHRIDPIEPPIDASRIRQPDPPVRATLPLPRPAIAADDFARDVEEADVEIVLPSEAGRAAPIAPPPAPVPPPAASPPRTPRFLRKSAVPDDADLADIVDEASVEIVRLDTTSTPDRRHDR